MERAYENEAMKVNVPVYIFPVNQKEGEVIAKLPESRDLKIRIRKEDVVKLRRMRGITVLSWIEEIEDVVKSFEQR